MREKDYWVRHEHGTEQMPIEAARELVRVPIIGILDDIRSAHNVGSMFRTADGTRLQELFLCGYSPTPPHKHLSKTALRAVEVVPWRHFETTQGAIETARAEGYQVLAMEKTDDSVPLWEFEPQFPVALVMGNEADGLSDELRAQCDATVHLPMMGLKSSLNVSVAFGVATYEVLKRYLRGETEKEALLRFSSQNVSRE